MKTFRFVIASALLMIPVGIVQAAAPMKNGDNHAITQLDLKASKVIDATRLIAELSGVNVVSTQEAGQREVTLFLRDVSARDAIDTLCKISGLWYRQDPETKTYRIMTTQEYRKDLVVFREDLTRVFTMLHPNALSVATAVEDLYGERVELSLGVDEDELDRSGFGSGGFLADDGTARDSLFRSGRDRGRFSRSTGYRDDFLRGSSTFSGRRGNQESERYVDEELTTDQIIKLEERAGINGGVVSSDALEGISKNDPPIYVTVNRQHNLIIVRTSDAVAMQDIEKLVKQLDRPTPQVLLEMKILELTLGDGFRSVFDIDYTTGDTVAGPETAQARNPLLTSAVTAPRNVLGVGNFPLESGTLIYQFMSDRIRARLQFLDENNRIQVLATPMILASNNRPARVFVGEERVLTTGVETDVVTTATGPAASTVEPITEVRDIGNTLIVLPRINADRTVTLLINQDASSVLTDSTTIPIATSGGTIQEFTIDTVNTATIEGTIVAKDKMTIALGGLIRNTVNDDLAKVPLLGDVPVVGALFRRDQRTRTKTELVLLITPHILMTPEEGRAVTESRMKALSRHPYLEDKDQALEPHFDNAERRLEEAQSSSIYEMLPGREQYEAILEPLE